MEFEDLDDMTDEELEKAFAKAQEEEFGQSASDENNAQTDNSQQSEQSNTDSENNAQSEQSGSEDNQQGSEEQPNNVEDKYAKLRDLDLPPLVIDGQEIPVTIEDLYAFSSKGGKFTKKMQELAGDGKFLTAVKEVDGGKDAVMVALDILDKNKDETERKAAALNLLKRANLDIEDIIEDFEVDERDYRPTDRGKTFQQLDVEEVSNAIMQDPVNGQKVLNIVQKELPQDFKAVLSENAEALNGLYADVKNGIFDVVYPASKELALRDGNKRPSIDYYLEAGKIFFDSLDKHQTMEGNSQEVQQQYQNQMQTSKQNATMPKGSSSKKEDNIVDYENMSEEEFQRIYDKIMSV
jgi:hypothetical protein